jgi:unsaturated rhamnogalacturonyl hydrolase
MPYRKPYPIAWTLIAIVIVFCTNASFADEFSPDSIIKVMRKCANYRLSTVGAANIPASWDGGAYYTGLTALYRLTKDATIKSSILSWAQKNNWTPKSSGNPDDHCAAQTFCEMYILDPKPENATMYQPWKNIVDNNLMKTPHALGSAVWYWIDALYMAPPGMAMLDSITHDSKYSTRIMEYWWNVRDSLYVPKYHFYYRDKGFIRERCKDTAWCIAANGGPVFWGPGNAWLVGGMARVLKYMPKNHPERPAFAAHLRDICDSLLTKQQGDGLWTTSLCDSVQWPIHESSGTAFFCFAMAWGMNNGIMEKTKFLQPAKRAWSALVNNISPTDGRLRWCQHVNMRPYSDIDQTYSSAEGEGAFMLAGEEMYTLMTNTSAGKKGNAIMATTKKNMNRVVWMGGASDWKKILPNDARGVEVYDLHGRMVGKKEVKVGRDGVWILRVR